MKTPTQTKLSHPSTQLRHCSGTRLGALTFLALILAVAVLPAPAATIFWNGAGTSWSTVGSWSTLYTATSPNPAAVPGLADTALFNISSVNSAQTVYLGGNQLASAMTFSNTGTTTLLGGSAGSPAANTLTLGTNGAALTIAGVTALAGNVTIGDTSGGGANVTPTLAGATNNLITVASGRTLTFANGINFSTGKIENNGTGTTVLSAAGTGAGLASVVGTVNYNIIARLDSGTITLGSPSAFGTGVIDTRNETLQASTDLSGANKIMNTFDLATGTTIIGGSTNIELGGQFIVSNGGTSPGILINNTAATTISGNVYLSDLSTTGKTLMVTNLTTAGPVTISGLIANYTGGAGTAGGLTKTGSGTLIVSGANNTYSGTTTIGAGGLAAVLRAAATQALGTGTITFDTTGNASSARLELTNGISLNNIIVFSGRTPNPTVGIENLSGNNTLSGIITNYSGGSIYIFQSDAGLLTLGTAGATAINAFSGTRTNTLQGVSNGNIVGNIINGPGAVAITKAGTGTWSLSGSNTYSLGTSIAAGTLVMASTNALSTNNVTISGTVNATLDIATDGSDYPNTIGAGSSTIFTIASDVKTGSVGINHTLGTLSIGSGATPLQMNIISGPNVASGSPQITAPLLLSGGSGGTTIVNPTTAKMSFSSVTASVTSKTLQLDGTNTGNSITGIIADGGANVITLLKTNTSTWTLSGANTYSGSTTIAQGTLALGSGGSIGSANLILAGGATFDVSADSGYALGGTQIFNASGTVNGNFADSTGSQILPGGAGVVGTLTFNNNLNLAAGDTNKFDFNSTTNDLIVVNGNFTNSVGSVINLASLPAGGLANGYYTLFQVSGALGGSAANFTITGKPSPSRQSFSIVYTAGSPNLVQLQVSGSPASLVWAGTSSIWDIVNTYDWTNGVSADVYFDGDNVNFTDVGSALSPVLNTNVQPGSVTFNSANAYTLSGSGAINGSGGLTKTNSGTLTITTANGYTGVTALNGGVVSIASITNSTFASPIGAALAAPANLTFNGGTLQYTGGTAGTDHGATLNAGGGTVQVTAAATTLALSGTVVGSSGGGLTKIGNGALVLSGANTYNGNTTISSGSLQVGNGGATGSLGSGSTITDNGALVVLRTGTLTLTNNINGVGNLTNNGTGTLTLSGLNTFTGGLTVNTGIVQVASASGIGGTPAVFNPSQINLGIGELEASTSFNLADTNSGVTVNAGTIAVDTGVTLMISNQVSVVTSLTKSLPGTLILSGSNTISGILNVDSGTTTASDGALRIASTNALGGAQTIQIRANQGPGSSTLQLDGTAGSINVNPATFNWLGRNNFVPAIENIAGDNVWNPATVTFTAGGSYYSFQCDAGSLTLPGTFPSSAPVAGRNVSFAGPGYFSITGSLQSGGSTNISLFLTNNGSLTLWGGNSYSGITSLQGGTLNAADNSSFGTSTANIELAPFPGETAVLNISNATVNAQRIIVAGVSANTTSPGTGTVNQMNGTVYASQWVTIGSGGSATGNSGGTGTYNLSGGTLNVQNTAGGTQLEVANFTGSSGTLNISGSSSLSIENNAYISLGANANAGNGTVNQTGGTVTFYSDGGGTIGGTGILYLGKAAGLTGNYIYKLAGGTLTVPTITSASGNSLFYLNGGTLQAAKTNTAFMSGLTAAYISTNISTLDDGGFPITITQPLLHDPALGATADGGLTKQNSGVLTLAGTNTYTGPTIVINGLLWINGSQSSWAVSQGSGILGGDGTINNLVDIRSQLSPGAPIGVLTVNSNLTLEAGTTAQFNFGTGTNSRVIVSGAVNVNGATTVSINYISSVVAVGTYPLIQYGSLTGFGNLTVPTSPNPRFTFSLSNNPSTKTISLVVSGNPASLVWHGDGSGNYWDNTGSYQNWLNGASADYFYDGDTVLFNNVGSNTPSIYLTATVAPTAVMVNSANNYDFAGSGSIAGPGSLTKSGSGTLTLEDNNSYTGPTIINGGTLQIGNGSTTGTLGSGNITNNASLVLDHTDATVMPSPIYGSGSVTMSGSGSVTATSDNFYTGNTLINSGIVYLPDSAGLGATNGTISVASGAQLYFTAAVNNGGNPLTLIGTGDGNGALRSGGSATSTYNGAVTLTGNTTISVDGGATLNLVSTNGVNGAGANANLTLSGAGSGVVGGSLSLGTGGLTNNSSGTWTLGGSNSMSFAAVNAGTLILANNNALSPYLNVALSSTTGGAGLSGTRLTLSGGISIPATRTNTMSSSGAGTIRTAFFSTGAGLTNAWAGSVLLTGDSSSSGNTLAFGADANSTFVISGNVSSDATFLGGKLILRGTGGGASSTPTGLGFVTGNLALDPANGQLQVDDGTTWVLSGTGNTWLTTIISGNSTLRLGANNALPAATLITVGNSAANRFDLAGFNQTVAGLGATAINITNTSATTDSTLTYSSASTTTFGGTISDGASKLNLTITAGNLTLTNQTVLNLTKSTVSVASGAVLEMDYTGTNTVGAFVTNGISAGPGLYSVANAAPYLASSTGTAYLLVPAAGPTGPAQITNSVSGNTLHLSWPAGQGWRLQAQTNSVSTGISTNWSYVTDSTVSSTNLTVNPTNPTVFYRLVYP